MRTSYETETGDLVICSNCGFTGEVERASDKCPECKMDGALQWDLRDMCKCYDPNAPLFCEACDPDSGGA